MTDYSSASDILAQLQDGSLTAAALMEHTLARIEAVNPDLNAIVGLRPAEELMEEARRADAMRAANGPSIVDSQPSAPTAITTYQ